MSTTYRYRVIILTLLIILSLSLTAFAPSAVAYAADGSNTVNFDSTDVLDDLKGSALNGVPFDVADYPYNKNGEIAVLGFVEYCYSEYENLRGTYGLYIYIYNPALLDIATGTGSNRIEMATEFSEDGTPTAYNKFSLQLCSVSDGVAANRFWKFKITDSDYFLDKVNVNARSYYVSGIEIQTYGGGTPEEIAVKMQYIWTGFAEGYGSATAGELKCDAEQMETIELEVQHTSYITGMSSLGNGHYNQIHTAYFAVPDYYFENYGKLQKIFAEWYEYKLKNMLVTSNEGFASLAQKYTATSGYTDQNGYKNGESKNVPYSLYYGATGYVASLNDWLHYEWGFNMIGLDYNDFAAWQTLIPLVFYSEVENPYEIFKFLNHYKVAGGVNSNEVLDAIYAYSNNLGNGYVEPADRKISKDLFYDYVDEGRIYGFQQREVDFEDTFELDSYDSNHDWWDEILDFGIFGKPEDIDVDLMVQPIYDVKETDLSGSDEEIADRLYISERDVDAFKEYYNAYRDTHHIILFRFANTDYFSRQVGYRAIDREINPSGYAYKALESDSDAYVCSETIFLNFDIISLTFNDDGEYRAFAVVSEPIDVVGDLEPPADNEFAENLEEFGQAVKNFFNRIGDWFKSIGDWFKNNWKWFVIGIAAIIALVLIGLFVKFIISIRGNKVNIHVDSPTASSKRSSSKKSPRRKT